MDPAATYATSRQRLLDLAPSLSADQRAASLPATPPWTATDAYRHLAGVCADVLAGNMPASGPAGGDAWTAAQLEQRADWPLEQVCEQWAAQGSELDARITAAGPAMGFVALDSWTHEQDVRAATGVGGMHDCPSLPTLIDLTLGGAGAFYLSKGGPTLRLVLDGEERLLGDGEPGAELRTSPYELMRMVFGRRSTAQIAAADWSGAQAETAQGALHLFDPPPMDLID